MVEYIEGRLDAMVCGVGSGGTLTGLSRYFSRTVPSCQMVLADPRRQRSDYRGIQNKPRYHGEEAR